MLYRRGEIWYARFTANGTKVHRSTRTADRTQAEQVEARWRNELWNQQHLGKKPDHLWQEAVTSWLRAKHNKRSLEDDVLKLEWLEQFFKDKPLREIGGPLIEETLGLRDISNATWNRYWAVIRGVLVRARKMGWIDALPNVEKRQEPPKTPSWLTPEQAEGLIRALSTPRRQHLADMVRFSLATGMRESNVTGLTWDRVNMLHRFAYVEAQNYKGQRTFRVPLNAAAMAVLESRAGIHDTHVFSYRGKPVRKANRAGFQAATEEAGVPWLRWHDLRHTWASWHVMNGTPLAVLKELGGWSDLSMVMRYAHLAPGMAEQYAGNVAQNVPQCTQETKGKAVSR